MPIELCQLCVTFEYAGMADISERSRSRHGVAPVKRDAAHAVYAGLSGRPPPALQKRVSAWSKVGSGPLNGLATKSARRGGGLSTAMTAIVNG